METLINTAKRSEVREQVLEDLYRQAFPAFARYASGMDATLNDAKDVFHDALILYYEKTLDPAFEVRKSPVGYVLGIARHLLLKKLRIDRRQVSFDDVPEDIEVVDEPNPSATELTLLSLIERTGKRCLELLSKFYYEKASLREIAAWLGYRTEHSASVQKHKCIRKIRDEIRTQSLQYEDFNV